MKKVMASCLLMALWWSLGGSGAWAIDVGWMQQGVRVWYFGGASTGFSSDAEEAYLFTAVNGASATLTHNSGINHWSMPSAVTETGSIIGQGPFWIHPQALQTIKFDDVWQGHTINNVIRGAYTYDSFLNEVSPGGVIPYLLLPIKALFDLSAQRNLVKIVYQIDFTSTGIAYFDADTGLLLLRENSTGLATVFFILSEINYDFATHAAFAEDNGPHTGFKSNITKTTVTSQYLMIQSSVESRYGNTVQMWTNTSAGGGTNIYLPPDENYCFFGDVPELRRKNMSATPNYPPENWNEYGDYLWWWVPTDALQGTSIDVFDVPMSRTATNPYTFTATGTGTALYFSGLVFDNDGYMTDFAARYPAIGLVIDLGPSASTGVPIHQVDGLTYYKNTMGNAVPPVVNYHLALTVVSDTVDKGGGSVNDGGTINCSGLGSDPSGMSGTCQGDFISGATVSMTQSPDADSTWAQWSVAGCGTSQNCQVQMTGDRNVTVTFPYSNKARVVSSGYGCETLALAYGNAAAVDSIYGRDVTFQESFTLSEVKSITLLGGRDAWYLPQNAWTTIQGMLTIQRGSLTVDRLAIR